MICKLWNGLRRFAQQLIHLGTIEILKKPEYAVQDCSSELEQLAKKTVECCAVKFKIKLLTTGDDSTIRDFAFISHEDLKNDKNLRNSVLICRNFPTKFYLFHQNCLYHFFLQEEAKPIIEIEEKTPDLIWQVSMEQLRELAPKLRNNTIIIAYKNFVEAILIPMPK